MTESQQSADTIDFAQVLRILRRRWPLIVLSIVVCAGVAYGLSKTQTKKYSATTSILFNQSTLDDLAAGLTPTVSSAPAQQTATNFALLTSQGTVPQSTATAIGRGLTAGEVRGAISVAPQGATTIAELTATSTSPTLAAEIANTYAAKFIALNDSQETGQVAGVLRLLNKQLAALTPGDRAGPQGAELISRVNSLRVLKNLQSGDVQVIRQASVPGGPSSPNPRRDAALGVVAGILIALILVLILERFDRRLRTVDDLERALGLPLLGAIPHLGTTDAGEKDGSSNGNRAATVLSSVGAMEAFQMLRAHLRYFNIDRDIRVVLITSESPAEGKTLVSSHLAEAAATMGSRVLLLDGDLRRDGIAEQLHLDPGLGLADVLIGRVSLQDAIKTVSVETRGGESRGRLDVVVSGPHPPNPARLLESEAMASLLEEVRAEYDFVVIDTSPLSVVSDAIPLTRHADGVIIVGRIGHSTRDGERRLLQRLQNLGAPVLGVVANDVSAQAGYGYGYGYGYGNRPKEADADEALPDAAAAVTNGVAHTGIGNHGSDRVENPGLPDPSDGSALPSKPVDGQLPPEVAVSQHLSGARATALQDPPNGAANPAPPNGAANPAPPNGAANPAPPNGAANPAGAGRPVRRARSGGLARAARQLRGTMPPGWREK